MKNETTAPLLLSIFWVLFTLIYGAFFCKPENIDFIVYTLLLALLSTFFFAATLLKKLN